MDQRARDVRRDIEHTRAALANKIEILDEEVRDKIEGVKNSVDISYQVQQRPWPMLATSVAVGFLLKRMLSGSSASSRADSRRPTFIPIPMYPDGRAEHAQPAAKPASAASQSTHTADAARNTAKQPTPSQKTPSGQGQRQEDNSGLLTDVMEQFKGELHTIKGMAVGAVTSLVHDMIKQTTPAAGSFVKQALNTASTKLPGQGIPEAQPETRPAQPNGPAHQQNPQTTQLAASAFTATRPPSPTEGRS